MSVSFYDCDVFRKFVFPPAKFVGTVLFYRSEPEIDVFKCEIFHFMLRVEPLDDSWKMRVFAEIMFDMDSADASAFLVGCVIGGGDDKSEIAGSRRAFHIDVFV